MVKIVKKEERTAFWMILISLGLIGLLSWIREVHTKVEALKLTHLGDGVFKADGTEQIVFEYERVEPYKLSGQFDLQEMEVGDVVLIKQYFKIRKEEPYKLYEVEEYRDKQERPIIHITPKEVMYGCRITLQQTAGVFKTFRWIFYAGFTS